MTSMSPCIIEINDIGLRASWAEREPVSSPGYALLQTDKLIFGEAARSQARLHPHELNNRFWQRLSMDPIEHFGNVVRHHADLAYAHLLQLHDLAGKPEEVIFAVPGNYSNEQLSVLLGIARQCPFQAVGLVDLAVAAVAAVQPAGEILHIDLQLHQAVLTKLTVGDEITRDAVQTVEGTGLLALYDRWAHVIADAFIEQCRFDPLHSAKTEQFLYDHLQQYLSSPALLVDLEVSQGGSVHRAGVNRDSLSQVGARTYRQLLDRAANMSSTFEHILLSHRWAAVPGVESFSPPSRLLTADASASVCREHAELIRSNGEAVSFVTRLPKLGGSLHATPAEAASMQPSSPLPTHLLVNDTAFPLNRPCFLQNTADGVTCSAKRQQRSQCTFSLRDGQVLLHILDDACIWLDDRPVSVSDSRQSLAAGASLRLSEAGKAVKLIRVCQDGEA